MSGLSKFVIHDRGNNNPGIKLRYRIRVSGKYTRSGKIEYWSFRTKIEAEQARANLLNNIRKQGQTAILDSPRDMTDAAMAKKLLEEAGLKYSLTDTVKKYLILIARPTGTLSVGELFTQYAAAKLEGWRASSKSNYKTFSKIFLEEHSPKNTSVLTPVELEQWMTERFSTPVYFNTAYILYNAVFNWGVKREIITNNPFDKIEKRKIRNKGLVDIFTLEETRTLLHSCQDYRDRNKNPYFAKCKETKTPFPLTHLLDCTDILPSIALSLFSGLRPAEIERLTWDDILLDHGTYGTIRVLPEKSKTDQLRNVEITANLRVFLDLIPTEKRIGAFIPTNYKRKLFLVKLAANLQNRRDTARHSYASYWLAKWHDVNALRENLGHQTKEILFKHYRTAVLKADADQYWSLTPQTLSPPSVP